MKIFLGLFLCVLITSCQPHSNTTSNTTPVLQAPNNTITEKPLDETSFTFTVQKGKEIKANVASKNENGVSTYVALFTPAVPPTDGNLYLIALTMLETFYGKGRGLIQLKDAKIEEMPGGNFVCWQINNPSQKFCLAQVKVSDKDKSFGGAVFLVK